MSMKIITIFLLLSYVNITLGNDCKVKLYSEENYRGHSEEIVDSKQIKGYSFSEELILASKNCSLNYEFSTCCVHQIVFVLTI